jgi:hypothetical protein
MLPILYRKLVQKDIPSLCLCGFVLNIFAIERVKRLQKKMMGILLSRY